MRHYKNVTLVYARACLFRYTSAQKYIRFLFCTYQPSPTFCAEDLEHPIITTTRPFCFFDSSSGKARAESGNLGISPNLNLGEPAEFEILPVPNASVGNFSFFPLLPPATYPPPRPVLVREVHANSTALNICRRFCR